MMMKRKIDWMSRVEFFRYHLISSLLYALDAFPVNRQGVCVRAIRTSIRRVRSGRIIGIFPEGGVTHARDSALLGGPIKKGACVVAYRAAAPIVPVVVLGTDKLNCVGPWLPFRRGRVWLIFGRPIHPPLNEPRRRVARDVMARALQSEFQSLYQELCSTYGIDRGEAAQT
jgi:1-acyl-sn-glycerol-3-phosphate acyltransferase